MKFISLGSGSSGNSYLLLSENGGLVIDAGIGVKTFLRFLSDLNIDRERLSALIITHDHIDHVKAAGAVSEKLSLPVYATLPVFNSIMNNCRVRGKIPPGMSNIITHDSAFSISDFNLRTFSVPHDSSDCVGFEIRHKTAVFVIMTDIGHITDEMKRFIHHADYLVIEANHDLQMLRNGRYPLFLKKRIEGEKGHTDNYSCAAAIAENMSERLRHIWLCHLSEENNRPELARKTVESVLLDHGIHIGDKLRLDVLDHYEPSRIFEL